MRKAIIALAIASPGYSASFSEYVENLCKSPSVLCAPEYSDSKTVSYRYAGEGYRSFFWVTEWQWKKWEAQYAKDWAPKRFSVTASSHHTGSGAHIMSLVSYTRRDELETQKSRINTVRVICASGFGACGYAISKMVGFWPGFAASVACTGSAFTCEMIAGDMIGRIDKELEGLNQAGHTGGSSSSGSAWVTGWSNPHSIPTLPPLPNGIVTINDNPGVPLGGDYIP